jgi:hypothetical protein
MDSRSDGQDAAGCFALPIYHPDERCPIFAYEQMRLFARRTPPGRIPSSAMIVAASRQGCGQVTQQAAALSEESGGRRADPRSVRSSMEVIAQRRQRRERRGSMAGVIASRAKRHVWPNPVEANVDRPESLKDACQHTWIVYIEFHRT